MASSSFPPRLGALLADRYQLRELLGAGGVGQVFRAWDVNAQRQVTVKAFNPVRCNQTNWTAFVAAVNTAATVRHPDVVLPEGLPAALSDTPVATTPAIAGDDLAKLRSRTVTIPWARALEIGERAAEILHAVHAATGMGHRDLKATNLLVTPEGAVKVLDWGVAEFDEQSGDRTRVDTALGVVDYKSPEQLDSNTADPKTDQFSLAVIIYEMICGERPFTGPSYFEVARKILFQPATPLTEVVPDAKVPPAIDALLQRALQKRPADRFPDMKTMQRALADARRGVKSPTASLKTTTPAKVTVRTSAPEDDDVTTMAIKTNKKRTSASDARPRQPTGASPSVAPTQIGPARGGTLSPQRSPEPPPDATVVGPAPNADRTVALADMEQIAAQAGVKVPRTVIDLEPRKSAVRGGERTLILGDEGTPAAPAEGTLILGDDAHPKPAEGTLLIPEGGGMPAQHTSTDGGGGTMMIEAPKPTGGGWTLQKTLILINVACGILILIGLFVLVMSE